MMQEKLKFRYFKGSDKYFKLQWDSGCTFFCEIQFAQAKKIEIHHAEFRHPKEICQIVV